MRRLQLLLFLPALPVFASCAGTTLTREQREALPNQDHRIATLREAIRMERAHLDSFPSDSASRSREARLREEIEQAEADRIQTVQPPVDAREKREAEKDELRRVDEILRTRDLK